MKKLIFIALIFIGFNSVAQELGIGKAESITNKLEIITYNNVPILSVSHDSVEVNCSGAELLTAKLLMEYKQYCYNDSTYVIRVVDHSKRYEPINDTLDLSVIYDVISLHSIEEKWEHRTPTFEGFLDWLIERKKTDRR